MIAWGAVGSSFRGGLPLSDWGEGTELLVGTLVVVTVVLAVALLVVVRRHVPQRRSSLRPRSLQARLKQVAASLMLLAVAVSVALMVVPSLVHHELAELDSAFTKSLLLQDLKLELLAYEDASNRQALTGDPHDAEARRAHREALEQRLGEARRLMRDPAEAVAADGVARSIEGYLVARERAEAAGRDWLQMPGREHSSFQAAVAPLDAVVGLYAERGSRARTLARRWDTLGDLSGVIGAAVLMGGVLGALLWVRREVYVPLDSIRSAIAALGDGARESRTSEDGLEEIAGIGRAFNLMAARLEQEREGRAAFLASVVHELRTPLSALKVATASLKLMAGGGGDGRQARLLGTMDRQITRLDRMLGDLLFAARAEAGQMELSFAPCDLRAVVHDGLELYRSFSEQHVLSIELPEGAVWVRGDAVRLEQVLVNLVSNAFKYSPAGGTVRVRLEASGEALLAVSDQGIGIARKDLEGLFEPFRRVGSLRDKVSGVGLGLSVTRRLVEAHGGRIEVESTPGQGSTFRIRLPLAEAPPDPPGDAAR